MEDREHDHKVAPILEEYRIRKAKDSSSSSPTFDDWKGQRVFSDLNKRLSNGKEESPPPIRAAALRTIRTILLSPLQPPLEQPSASRRRNPRPSPSLDLCPRRAFRPALLDVCHSSTKLDTLLFAQRQLRSVKAVP